MAVNVIQNNWVKSVKFYVILSVFIFKTIENPLFFPRGRCLLVTGMSQAERHKVVFGVIIQAQLLSLQHLITSLSSFPTSPFILLINLAALGCPILILMRSFFILVDKPVYIIRFMRAWSEAPDEGWFQMMLCAPGKQYHSMWSTLGLKQHQHLSALHLWVCAKAFSRLFPGLQLRADPFRIYTTFRIYIISPWPLLWAQQPTTHKHWSCIKSRWQVWQHFPSWFAVYSPCPPKAVSGSSIIRRAMRWQVASLTLEKLDLSEQIPPAASHWKWKPSWCLWCVWRDCPGVLVMPVGSRISGDGETQHRTWKTWCRAGISLGTWPLTFAQALWSSDTALQTSITSQD